MSATSLTQILQLALAHHQAGRAQEAEALYRQVLAADPNQPDALHFLGLLAHQADRNDAALALMQHAIAMSPSTALYYSNLSSVLRKLGRLREAADACRQAIAIQPDYGEAHTNLGIAFQEQGRSGEAIQCYRRALQLRPDCPVTCSNLGVALQAAERFAEAEEAYARALALHPGFADAYSNLASLHLLRGNVIWAAECCRKAVALRPDKSSFHSSLLYALEFHPRMDIGTLQEEKRLWAQRHAAPLAGQIRPHANDRNPDRPLRIGYISPNLRGHIIGTLLEALASHHDHAHFHITCYSDTLHHDATTERLQHHSDAWRDTAAMTDAQLSEQVRADAIDILVDLNLHMAGDRMLVFARKPAPIQVTYLGYPASTGLESIDYRITDRYLSPADQPLEGPEKLVCLPHGYWPYSVQAQAPLVNDLPAATRGFVTFCCFNNLSKVNADVIAVWSALMQRLPQSRLRLLAAGPADNAVYEAFERAGIDRQRLELVGRQPSAEYLLNYHEADIALDPFPYNGHTTSYDALFMGVPIVTLAGQRSVARAGASILSNLDLADLVARTPEQYVQIASDLAGDLPRLAGLRRSLRQRMLDSALMDAPGLARAIEDAFRQMWITWVRRQV